MAYAVFRSDLMSGTDVAADLVSIKYHDGSNDPAEIENGCVVKLDGLLSGEREIYKGVDPAKNTNFQDIVIIGSPELLYDERKKNLNDFVNPKDKAARGYVLRNGNVFSVTKEALVGLASPVSGNIVELADGNKLSVAATATAGSTKIGTIIEVEETVRYTYYVIRIGA